MIYVIVGLKSEVNVLKSTYLLRADSIGPCRYRKHAGAEREGIEPAHRIEKEEIEYPL